MQKQNVATIEQAGYAPAEWCQAVSFSRAKLYQLPADMQPHSVKLGRRRIITESPSAFLARIAAMMPCGAK